MLFDKLSAIISLLVATVLLAANYFQWWDITWDGSMKTRKWVKVLFLICIFALIASWALLLWP